MDLNNVGHIPISTLGNDGDATPRSVLAVVGRWKSERWCKLFCNINVMQEEEHYSSTYWHSLSKNPLGGGGVPVLFAVGTLCLQQSVFVHNLQGSSKTRLVEVLLCLVVWGFILAESACPGGDVDTCITSNFQKQRNNSFMWNNIITLSGELTLLV